VTLRNQADGPVPAIGGWGEGYDEPVYLLTNVADVDEVCAWYRKRARIDTFFSDQKSRGFNLHKSHLSDPPRLARLMMAACLAYIWIIDLGVRALHDQWRSVVHRNKRCETKANASRYHSDRWWSKKCTVVKLDTNTIKPNCFSRALHCAIGVHTRRTAFLQMQRLGSCSLAIADPLRNAKEPIFAYPFGKDNVPQNRHQSIARSPRAWRWSCKRAK